MMTIANIQEFRSVSAWNVPFAHSLYPGYKRAEPRNIWPDQGPSTQRLFSTIQDFWLRSEAVGLAHVSKMLRQLTGQMSAHYPSSKIRNTHLRLFRPDQGPHIVYLVHAIFTKALWR